jgi:hypothetical protein
MFRKAFLISLIVGCSVLSLFGQEAAPAQVEVADITMLDTNKTSTMQKELQAAADQGYRLLPNQGTWLLSALLERKKEPVEPIEYLLLATSKSGTMQKEMTQAAAEGYRFASTLGQGGEVIVAMQRPKGATKQTHELKLLATVRFGTMKKEFMAEIAKGYRFVGQSYFQNWMGQIEYVAILERPVK